VRLIQSRFRHLPTDPAAVLGQLSYFGLVTLATVGYGDIVPVHPLIRSLATFEAITGQLYITVLIARLVGLHIADRQQG
jgi:Na+/H+-dicarboxylate symporter